MTGTHDANLPTNYWFAAVRPRRTIACSRKQLERLELIGDYVAVVQYSCPPSSHRPAPVHQDDYHSAHRSSQRRLLVVQNSMPTDGAPSHHRHVPRRYHPDPAALWRLNGQRSSQGHKNAKAIFAEIVFGVTLYHIRVQTTLIQFRGRVCLLCFALHIFLSISEF